MRVDLFDRLLQPLLQILALAGRLRAELSEISRSLAAVACASSDGYIAIAGHEQRQEEHGEPRGLRDAAHAAPRGRAAAPPHSRRDARERDPQRRHGTSPVGDAAATDRGAGARSQPSQRSRRPAEVARVRQQRAGDAEHRGAPPR